MSSEFEKITVEVVDGDHVIRKAFEGRLLVADFHDALHAAQGKAGGFALWETSSDDGLAREFRIYDTWDEVVQSAYWSDDFLSAISLALGGDYAEEIQL